MITDDDPRAEGAVLANADSYRAPDVDYLAERREEREAQQRAAALGYALQLPRPHADHTAENVVAAAEAFFQFLRRQP